MTAQQLSWHRELFTLYTLRCSKKAGLITRAMQASARIDLSTHNFTLLHPQLKQCCNWLHKNRNLWIPTAKWTLGPSSERSRTTHLYPFIHSELVSKCRSCKQLKIESTCKQMYIRRCRTIQRCKQLVHVQTMTSYLLLFCLASAS